MELLARTFYISRRDRSLSWLEAILRRWYDIFLLLTFWRWLRIIPVTIRIYQADLLNIEPLRWAGSSRRDRKTTIIIEYALPHYNSSNVEMQFYSLF
ncbi:hypothetical protein ACEYW6_02270 [Nostoc sp. UIC 10607]|uniref:hypothetical protein n=1 Tax=Nostoc sp. UIC 10607 TaxID=3045935 RepID=UPI0039A3F718